jgi:hypothetical protein
MGESRPYITKTNKVSKVWTRVSVHNVGRGEGVCLFANRKNGYRDVSRSSVAPKSRMVSKNRGNTVITFVPGNVGWPRG